MRMTTSSSVGAGLVVLVATVCLLLPAATRAQLQVGFYNTSCPNAEALVRQAVAAAFANNSGIAAGLIRLHFHDCFVRGCDASVLLSVNPGGGKTEREAPPNNPSLRGFEVVDAAKAAIERSCPRTVSCADILAFAARDSVNLTGNVFYQVPAGRRDGNVSKEGDALKNLPGPNNTATGLIDGFAAKNLTAEEMVVLSGSHTIGRSHCDSFLFKNRERLANGTISPAYQALLEALCPPTTNQFTPNTTEIDLSTPTVLDNNYYKLLPLNLGLHFSDDQLIRNATTAPNVAAFAANETLWKEKFISAMIKMGRIEVNTGAQGEVRLNCSIVNAPSSSTGIEMLLPGTSDDRADEVATS
ncbi:peroxidase 1-like isoform X1 [Phragmites australis]|uniref:peroxidase 1-like isoform X1 n=1 Tax=Phragmites australis TaxID=29695 RepID=UPI002D78ECB6|nr:peroxidase 1-like isoform X1 [Phragmites australis]